MAGGRHPEHTIMSDHSVFPLRRILWLTAALFFSYLSVAMSLPVISIFVVGDLGHSNAAGGLAVGIAFLATILTRGYAGRQSDGRGGKQAVVKGFCLYALAGLVCLVAASKLIPPEGAFILLLAGRLLLGVGESLALVGTMGWGLNLSGPLAAGRFLAMLGAGMYGSFAFGGPLGIAIYNWGGFAPVCVACALMPMLGLAMVAGMPGDVVTTGGASESLFNVVGRIWRHGVIVGLQGVGFAAIGAFQALLFKIRGWPHAGAGLAVFALGFVAMRLVGPYLLERLGGKKLVIASLLVEIAGQLMLWLAPGPWVAIAGAFLTGIGCSMIYPAMGGDIVTQVPGHLRGTAMGAFTGFQDVAYALTGPVAGMATDHFGGGVAFLIGTIAAMTALGCLFFLRMGRRAPAR